jgi:hypothetical protein
MKILRLACVQHGFVGLLMLVAAILPADLSAHEGHDHEEEAAVAQAATPLAGREVLELTSDLYEAVIERRTERLRIYLDLYETNEPVADARVAVDFGSAQGLIAAQKAPGQYEVALEVAAAEESVPVTLTIQSSAGDDLLGGTFDAPAQDEHSWFEELGHWLEHYGMWLLAAALLAGVALFLRRRSRAAAVSASAWILAGAALLSLSDVQAHEGHDHEDELASTPVPADSGTRPMRLPDGSLFVPKVTQRILAVRTTVTREGSAPLTVRLAGEITGDPRASAAIQTLQGGRVASGDAAWPVLGASVRRGQPLLRLTPTGSGTERAGAAAERARVESDLSLARTELARLENLSGIVAPAEVATARARVASLQAQRAAFGATLGSGEVLRAPIDGVIAAMNAAPGAIAQPGEMLLTVIDPRRLSVQALAFEPIEGGAASIARATVALRNGQKIEARVAGVGSQLQGGAVPVRLDLTTVAEGAVVGQPVVVFLERKVSGPGLSLPAESVVRQANGERVVFEKIAAERFMPRVVRVRQISADRIAVLAGLEPDTRVVVAGASLLTQIR